MTKEELYKYYIVEKHTRANTAMFFNVTEDQLKRILSKYRIVKKQRGAIHPVTWTVYRHINKINGKSYIGITCQRWERSRWGYNGHGYNQYGQKKFWNAIKKYGWDNFDHEILEKNIPTPEEANEREKYWIEQFDSFKNGYNATIGGSGATGHKVNEKARRKMGEANIGSKHHTQKHSEETRKLISERHKGKHLSSRTEFKKGHLSWLKGKPMLPHVKEALRQANLGKTPYNKGKFGGENILSKPIVQYDLEGNFIKKWPSAHEIHEIYGCDRSSIARCCRGEYKQLIGFVWFYEDNIDLYRIKIAKKSQEKRFRKVEQYDLDGNYIKTYETISQAEKENKLNHCDIICCCQGKRKQAGGYIWRYKK